MVCAMALLPVADPMAGQAHDRKDDQARAGPKAEVGYWED